MAWLLSVLMLEDFRAAWHAGRPFWRGTGLYGAELDIRLGDVTGIVHHTAASIALRKEEDEIIRVRMMVDGNSDD